MCASLFHRCSWLFSLLINKSTADFQPFGLLYGGFGLCPCQRDIFLLQYPNSVFIRKNVCCELRLFTTRFCRITFIGRCLVRQRFCYRITCCLLRVDGTMNCSYNAQKLSFWARDVASLSYRIWYKYGIPSYIIYLLTFIYSHTIRSETMRKL